MTTRRTIDDPSARRLGPKKPAAQRRGPPVAKKPPARRRPTVTSKVDVKRQLKAGISRVGRAVTPTKKSVATAARTALDVTRAFQMATTGSYLLAAEIGSRPRTPSPSGGRKKAERKR